MRLKFLLLFLGIFLLPFCSSAHYIVGIVNNSLDGTNANDHIVVLWNSANGMNDNLTDVIGLNGNSGANNFYMIDCEMLNDSCDIGDNLKIKVYDPDDGYTSNDVEINVTGAGYDIAPNIIMNSPPNFFSLIVDDDIAVPINEVDLFGGTTRFVSCEAIIEEFDLDALQNITAEFFDFTNSFYGDNDDNNLHYSNSSCFINSSYGDETQSQVICGFSVLYNANSENWRCVMNASDNVSMQSSSEYDATFINELLSIEMISSVDFGIVDGGTVSNESIINITNMGNVKINLSLSGYGTNEGDNYSMSCDIGNVSIWHKKYNLTASTPGELSLSEFEDSYINLTSSSVIMGFDLDYRKNEVYNEAINSTYWRIYVPTGVSGTCQGNIFFGAVLGEGS